MVDFVSLAEKWRKRWASSRVYESDPDPAREPFFLVVAYPYPSGAMHLGHARTYAFPDVVARFQRLRGKNVLLTMGWHVTGTPVLAQTELVKARDPKTLSVLSNVCRIPENDIPKLETPEGFVNYFVEESPTGYKVGFKELSIGFDWRREVRTMDVHYNKFIEWQYLRLKELGYIVKGDFPVRYCPKDKQAVGDHDLREGEGVGITEFTVLKFPVVGKDFSLVAATLRPETVFGQTNLWVDSSASYVKAMVDGSLLVASSEFFDKVKLQKLRVEIVGGVPGSEIVGLLVKAPGVNREIPVLPSLLCDSSIGTGIVTSVPSDAPADYIALVELQGDASLRKQLGVQESLVKNIHPIEIINTPGLGSFPSKVVCERLGITSQGDAELLERAKKEVYKAGFHTGVLLKSCGKFSGLKVSEAKEQVKKELIKKKQAFVLKELEGRVTCRCGSRVVAALLEGQWFLKYSDPEWKRQAKEHFAKMVIVPEVQRANFDFVFDWLEDKPCARLKGLGTRMPWDHQWIIEPLSDSTIYMAYFTISHLLKKLDASCLIPEVFDYVFQGKGLKVSVSKKSRIDSSALEELRASFEYWYPLRFNVSASELVPNHMTFTIFHHVALFRPEHRIRGEICLGMGTLDGLKMSSSKGHVALVNDLSAELGPDVMRLFLMNFVEPWQDFDWDSKVVEGSKRLVVKRFEVLLSVAEECKGSVFDARKLSLDDRYILSRCNRVVGEVTKFMELFLLRKSVQLFFFDFLREFEEYLSGVYDKGVASYIIERAAIVLSPFTPHICEELWHGPGMVVNASWPVVDASLIDTVVESERVFHSELSSDIGTVLSLVSKGVKPSGISLFIAPEWKRIVARKVKELLGSDTSSLVASVKSLVPKEVVGDAVKLSQFFVKTPGRIPQTILSEDEEFESVLRAKEFLESKFGARVSVVRASSSKSEKSLKALPSKPAILID